MSAMRVVKDEIAVMVAVDRIVTVLMRNVSTAAESVIHTGDEVLMFRGKPVVKWVGPYRVTKSNCKTIKVATGVRLIDASIDRVKPYVERRDPR